MRGIGADVLTAQPVTLSRFSRWTRRTIRSPRASSDPLGYLALVGELMSSGEYEAVLATHEQAWLFAAGRALLAAGAPIAVAGIEAFDRVQGKVEFAALLEELDVPQPPWWHVEQPPLQTPYPHWVKASHGTAGRSVRRVANPAEEAAAIREMSSPGDVLMGQAPAPGQYGQVQGLFENGRLIAVHTSVQRAVGAGGSAAARLSVDHPEARTYAARIGEHLGWHGSLTFDYLHQDGHPLFIECNPRMVEPGNAAYAGVDFPALTIGLATGRQLPAEPLVARPGVLTRSAMALALGAAENTGSRRAIMRAVTSCALSRGELGAAAEVLTPVRRDPPSVLPVGIIAAKLLIRPHNVGALARGAVEDYALSPAAIEAVKASARAT
jgi:hypothetical protein